MRAAHTLVLMLVVASSGCARRGGSPPPAATNVQEGKEISKNPFTAINQVAEMAKKMEQVQKELAEMVPIDPVHFSKLIEVLPEAPNGLAPDEPRGENNEIGDFKISSAERRYRAKDERTLTVKIIDHAHHSQFYAPFFMATQIKNQSTEGYQKGVTIDGNPGVEKYQKAGKSGDLTILVAKRFLIEIRTTNAPPEFLREVYGKIDAKKLAALK